MSGNINEGDDALLRHKRLKNVSAADFTPWREFAGGSKSRTHPVLENRLKRNRCGWRSA